MGKYCDVRIDISKSSCGSQYHEALKSFYIYFAVGNFLNFCMGMYYFVLNLYISKFVWKRMCKVLLCGVIFCGLEVIHSIFLLVNPHNYSSVAMEILAMLCWSFAFEGTIDYCKEWYNIVMIGQSFGVSNKKRRKSTASATATTATTTTKTTNNITTITITSTTSTSSTTGNNSVHHDELESNKNNEIVNGNNSASHHTSSHNMNDDTDEEAGSSMINWDCDVSAFHKILFKFIPQKWLSTILPFIQRGIYIITLALFIYAGYKRDQGDLKAHSYFVSVGFSIWSVVTPFGTFAIFLYGGEVVEMLRNTNIKLDRKEQLIFRISLGRITMGLTYLLFSFILAVYAAKFNFINSNEAAGTVFIVFYVGFVPPMVFLILYSLASGHRQSSNSSAATNSKNDTISGSSSVTTNRQNQRNDNRNYEMNSVSISSE